MSTYTSSLGLEQITPGDQAGLWGNTTNNNLALIDQAVTGVTPISFAALSGQTYTLTDFDGAVDESRSAVLNITGIAAGPNTVVIPNKQKMYLVRNNTGQNVVFQTPTPTATYTVGAGNSILIFCDGNNNVFTGIASPSVGTLSVSAGGTGSTTFTAGFVKSTGGTNALTSATTVDLASEVNGTLPVARGGTGAGAFTAGSLLIGNGTSNFGTLVGGGVGQVATWNGSQWTAASPASAGVSSITGGTGISVSSPTGAVSITNTGVTSLTAGSGITISGGSTGALSISASGTSGVSSVSVTSPVVNTGTASAPNIGIASSPTFSGTVSCAGLSSSSAINVSSGNINCITGTIGTGTGATGSTYGRIVGSSIQLWEPTNQSMFGNATGFGFVLSNTTIGNVGADSIRPGIDNLQTSGANIFRWSAVWAVNGTIQTSDARLKTNVTPSPLGLNFITKLKPVSYKWISGGKVEDGTTTPTEVGGTTVNIKNYKDRPGVRTHYGLIAQEVKQTLDELNVGDFGGWGLADKEDPDSTQSLNYGQFVAPLIKAVQELKAELDEAKAEIAALKAK